MTRESITKRIAQVAEAAQERPRQSPRKHPSDGRALLTQANLLRSQERTRMQSVPTTLTSGSAEANQSQSQRRAPGRGNLRVQQRGPRKANRKLRPGAPGVLIGCLEVLRGSWRRERQVQAVRREGPCQAAVQMMRVQRRPSPRRRKASEAGQKPKVPLPRSTMGWRRRPKLADKLASGRFLRRGPKCLGMQRSGQLSAPKARKTCGPASRPSGRKRLSKSCSPTRTQRQPTHPLHLSPHVLRSRVSTRMPDQRTKPRRSRWRTTNCRSFQAAAVTLYSTHRRQRRSPHQEEAVLWRTPVRHSPPPLRLHYPPPCLQSRFLTLFPQDPPRRKWQAGAVRQTAARWKWRVWAGSCKISLRTRGQVPPQRCLTSASPVTAAAAAASSWAAAANRRVSRSPKVQITANLLRQLLCIF